MPRPGLPVAGSSSIVGWVNGGGVNSVVAVVAGALTPPPLAVVIGVLSNVVRVVPSYTSRPFNTKDGVMVTTRFLMSVSPTATSVRVQKRSLRDPDFRM